MEIFTTALAVIFGVFGTIMSGAFIEDLIDYKHMHRPFGQLAIGLSVLTVCFWLAWWLW